MGFIKLYIKFNKNKKLYIFFIYIMSDLNVNKLLNALENESIVLL